MARIAIRLALGMMVATGCTGSIDEGSTEGEDPPEGTTPGGSTAGPATPGTRPGEPAAPGAPGGPPPGPGTPGAMASGPLAPAAMQRLTAIQYRNAVRDLLGTSVTPPSALEPDVPEAGFTSIGAAKLPLSGRGVEQYEGAAYDLARQVFANVDRRMTLVGCAPTAAATDPCARRFLERFGRRAYRRTLDAAETDQYAKLASGVATSFGDPWLGLEYAVAAILQSPFFLYRIELGEADPGSAARRRYSSTEMASRLAFALWQTLADETLLDAAARGELATVDGVRAQARRLLASSRAREGILRFFVEHFELERLDTLVKDAKIYPRMSATLGASMRREIEMSLSALAFDPMGDFRRLFDGRSTYVNPELARLYGVTAPAGTTFTAVELPAGGPRAGVFGFAGMMAMQARATATSPTLRGKFVRERLLCQPVPEPPPDVETTLPENGAVGKTLRERLEQHRTDPACAGCHALIDPIGVGLEKYDGLGAHREMDAGRPIDARSTLDGKPFDGALGLAGLLRNDEGTAACLARQFYRFSAGHLETAGEEVVIGALARGYKASGYRVIDLLTELVASDGFRYASAL